MPELVVRPQKIKVFGRPGGGVSRNSTYPAGRRVEFTAHSGDIQISALYSHRRILPYMSQLATSGIDIYVNKSYYGSIYPANNIEMCVRKTLHIEHDNSHVELYLPAFARIWRLAVDAKEGYKILEDRRDRWAIYGSSITQGCGASRPSLSYCNILQRKLDVTIDNYGFSEGAFGEVPIISYIAQREYGVIIIEYDHNADVRRLRETHWEVYQCIRKYNAKCIIVFLHRLSYGISASKAECDERIRIIHDTYQKAKDEGDSRVVFVDGRKLKVSYQDIFVDDRHPNDYGMKVLADVIENALEDIG
jgi:hypothetical protein